MSDRPTLDRYFLDLARLVSSRATCARRAVGCVLVDDRGRVLSTGYNGPPSGLPHCTDEPCPGANAAPGQSLDLCEAVHAEQNALLFCPSSDAIDTCYVTASPCVTCTKLLLNTPCRRIVFETPYAHDDRARALWLKLGRTWQEGAR